MTDFKIGELVTWRNNYEQKYNAVGVMLSDGRVMVLIDCYPDQHFRYHTGLKISKFHLDNLERLNENS
jgi:hypothetical protein